MNRILILTVIVVVLLATVFRVRQARRIMEKGRDLILIYFAAIIIMTVLWTWRNGF